MPCHGLAAAQAFQLRQVQGLLANLHFFIQAALFGHVADVCNILHRVKGLAVEQHFAFIGIKNAGDHAQQRGFAGAVRPQQSKDAALLQWKTKCRLRLFAWRSIFSGGAVLRGACAWGFEKVSGCRMGQAALNYTVNYREVEWALKNLLSGNAEIKTGCFVAPSSENSSMKKSVLIAVLAGCGLLCCSWGFLVHRTTTQLAIYQLPKSAAAAFYQNSEALVKASVRPDQRRNIDSTEAPKHFIDLEMYGDSAAWRMPHNWNAAVATYTKDTLEKYGYVPYWIIAVQEKLTAAFRAGNSDSVLYYAADLAHYIGDAHVPLHTTINYDGQLTNQKGLHSLWESTIPELELEIITCMPGTAPATSATKKKRIWSAVRGAYNLLPQVFLGEREASAGFTDSTKFRKQVRNGKETKTYTAHLQEPTASGWATPSTSNCCAAPGLMADFWYTAWVDAGKPDVRKFLKTPYTKAEQAAFRREFRSYKHNNLSALSRVN
jgi:hypothetical protein